MAKALGTTPAEEHKLGLHKIAQVSSLNPWIAFSYQLHPSYSK